MAGIRPENFMNCGDRIVDPTIAVYLVELFTKLMSNLAQFLLFIPAVKCTLLMS